jgi:pimeloyl-ACP methyl ester carboxylesterase
MADGMAGFAASVAKPRQPIWWEKNGSFDPLPYWAALTVPALAVYGAEDEKDNVPVSRSVELLEELRPAVDVTIEVYPDSGHGLFVPGTQTVRPELLQLLTRWITEKVQASVASLK